MRPHRSEVKQAKLKGGSIDKGAGRRGLSASFTSRPEVTLLTMSKFTIVGEPASSMTPIAGRHMTFRVFPPNR
jgi:hypothetical protein